jgi:hypothetical protein
MGHRPTLYPLGACRFRVMQAVRSFHGRPPCPIHVPIRTVAMRPEVSNRGQLGPGPDASVEEWAAFWVATDPDQGQE